MLSGLEGGLVQIRDDEEVGELVESEQASLILWQEFNAGRDASPLVICLGRDFREHMSDGMNRKWCHNLYELRMKGQGALNLSLSQSNLPHPVHRCAVV